MQREDRWLDVPGGRVASWRIASTTSSPAVPMLFLHGGPGSSCAGFSTLEELADDRPLVMWDQLGSTVSTWDGTPEQLWTMDRFCAEVDTVRAAHGLDEVIMFGHSWGGWLTIEYLDRQPAGVVAAVLADTSPGYPSFRASIARRVAELPADMRAAVRRELAGEISVDDPDYHRAAIEYYERFVVRNVPGDGVAAAAIARQRGAEVYQFMQGADELHADGTLASWDRRPSLPSIDVSTLVLVGHHDHMDPQCAAEIADGVPDAQLVEFAGSSHCPHLEQPGLVVAAIRTFLDEHPTLR